MKSGWFGQVYIDIRAWRLSERGREMETEMETVVYDQESALSFLQACYRNPSLNLTTRMRAAIAALPFESPKLAVTAMVSEQDFATVLDRRLKRIEEMKLLEKKTINGNATVTDRTIEPEPRPSPPMPAPLNRLYSSRFRRI